MSSSTILLNTHCNEKCLFCSSSFDSNYWLSTKAVLEKINIELQSKSDNSTQTIIFTGGEPTLRNDLPQLISFCKQNKCHTILQTNATEITKKLACDLKSSGLDLALVSLHSHKSEISDKITQLNGGFYKTVEGIEHLINSNITVNISIVINTLNYSELSKTILWINQKFSKINRFDIGFVGLNKNVEKNIEIMPRLQQVENSVKKTLKMCQKNKINFIISQCGMPLCFITGFEEYSQNLRDIISQKKDRIITEKKSFKNAVSSKNNYVKSIACKECKLNHLCLGLREDYFRLFGSKELKSVKNTNINKLIKKVLQKEKTGGVKKSKKQQPSIANLF